MEKTNIISCDSGLIFLMNGENVFLFSQDKENFILLKHKTTCA